MAVPPVAASLAPPGPAPAVPPAGALEPRLPTQEEFPEALDVRPARERLLDLVRSSPGLNKSAACQQLGVAWGTVSYHVERLRREGALETEAHGRDVMLFPCGYSPNLRRSAAALRDEESNRVLQVLATRRQASLLELSSALGVSRKVARRVLRGLCEAGLVQNQAKGRPRYVLASRAAGPPVTYGVMAARTPIGPVPPMALA